MARRSFSDRGEYRFKVWASSREIDSYFNQSCRVCFEKFSKDHSYYLISRASSLFPFRKNFIILVRQLQRCNKIRKTQTNKIEIETKEWKYYLFFASWFRWSWNTRANSRFTYRR